MDTIKFDDLKVTLGPPLSLQKGEVVGFTKDIDGIDQLLVQFSADGDLTPVYVFFNCQHWIYNRSLPVNPSHEQGITAFCIGKIAVVFTYGVNLVALGIYDADGRNTLLHPPCWPLFPAGTSFVVLPERVSVPGTTWTSPFYNETTKLPFDMIVPGNDVFGETRPLGTTGSINGGNKKHGRIISMHGAEYVAHNLDELLPISSSYLYVVPSDIDEVAVSGRAIGYSKAHNALLLGGIPFLGEIDFLFPATSPDFLLSAIHMRPTSYGTFALTFFSCGAVAKESESSTRKALLFGLITFADVPVPCIEDLALNGPVAVYDLDYRVAVYLRIWTEDWPYGGLGATDGAPGRDLYPYFFNSHGIAPIEEGAEHTVYGVLTDDYITEYGIQVVFTYNPELNDYEFEITTHPNMTYLEPVNTETDHTTSVHTYQKPLVWPYYFDETYHAGVIHNHVDLLDVPIATSGMHTFTGGLVAVVNGSYSKTLAQQTSSSAVIYKHDGLEIARVTANCSSSHAGVWVEKDANPYGYYTPVNPYYMTDLTCISIVFHYVRVDLGLYVFSEFVFADDVDIALSLDCNLEGPAPVSQFTARFVVWHNGVRTVVASHQINWSRMSSYLQFAVGGWSWTPLIYLGPRRHTKQSVPGDIGYQPTFFGPTMYVEGIYLIEGARNFHLPPISNFISEKNYWYDESDNLIFLQEFWNVTRTGTQHPITHHFISDPIDKYYFSGDDTYFHPHVRQFTPLYLPYASILGGGSYTPVLLQKIGQFMYLRVYDPFDNSNPYEFFTGPSSYLDKLKAAINPANPSQVTFTDDIS